MRNTEMKKQENAIRAKYRYCGRLLTVNG